VGDITYLLALGYGLLSFLSPCTLPLIPVYLANLTGGTNPGDIRRRRPTFMHSVSFVGGFTIMFALWGAGAGVVGSFFSEHLALMRHLAGALLIVFGIVMLASLKVPWLNYENRVMVGRSTRYGFVRSLLIGAVFPIAWTPCASWVLGGIIVLAGAAQTALKGASLLAVYSLGLGLPFLAVGLAFDYLAPWLKKISRFSTILYIVSGVLLVGVGVLILTDKVGWLLGFV